MQGRQGKKETDGQSGSPFFREVEEDCSQGQKKKETDDPEGIYWP